MATLRAKLGVTVGYSDHTLGIGSALVALGLGARIVEKHFTLDKNYSAFRDHALSAEPAEFAELAKSFKAHAAMLGTGLRDVTSDLGALDSEGFWAVVLPYSGAPVCARFDHVRPATPWPR